MTNSQEQLEFQFNIPAIVCETPKEKKEREKFEYNEKRFFSNLKNLADTINKSQSLGEFIFLIGVEFKGKSP